MKFCMKIFKIGGRKTLSWRIFQYSHSLSFLSQKVYKSQDISHNLDQFIIETGEIKATRHKFINLNKKVNDIFCNGK